MIDKNRYKYMRITFCFLHTSTVTQIKFYYTNNYEWANNLWTGLWGHFLMVTMVIRGARCVPSQVRAYGEEAVTYIIENSSNLSME